MAKRLSAKVLEVLENGGFLYAGTDESGRDLYRYERTGRNGTPYGAGGARECYTLTARGTLAFRCSCPEAARRAKAGDGGTCKHIDALDYWLSSDVPVIVPVRVLPSEIRPVVAPALSGWALCGL